MVPVIKLGAGAEKYTCPYCKTQFKAGDEAISCPACQTLHHASCWEENEGCATVECSKQHCEEQHTNPTNVCNKCGATFADDQEFCHKCGAKFVIKKNEIFKKKKKIVISSIAGTLFVAFALVFGIYLFPKYILPKINLNKAVAAFEKSDYASAVKYYEKSGTQSNAENCNQYTYATAMTQYEANEYKKAATTFSKTNGLLDSNDKIYSCALALEEKQKYENALDCFTLLSTSEANGHKYYCEGMIAYDKKDFSTAVLKLVAAKSTIENIGDFLPQVYYEYGVSLFDKKNYSAAETQFKSAGDYSDAKTYARGCLLMQAENLLSDGKLNDAKTAYSKLPQDFSFKNISVSNRVSALNDVSTFAAICGEWSATKNHIETRNVYKRDGTWDSWYIDGIINDQKLTINCRINPDGTVNMRCEVSFYRYTNYSSLSAYCKSTKVTKGFTISNLKSIPSSYNIDSTTTLKYSDGSFNIKYSERDNYSSYFYNLYKSSVTFGKRSITF